MNDLLDNRPRRIVGMASELVQSPEAKDWLWCDERGVWERRVAELLETFDYHQSPNLVVGRSE